MGEDVEDVGDESSRNSLCVGGNACLGGENDGEPM